MAKGRGRGDKDRRDELRMTLDSNPQGKPSPKRDAPDAKVERLIDLIGNEQFSIRMAAAKKLADLGEKAIPALLTALQEGLWYTRECAVQALGNMGSAEAIEPLLARLRDENVGVRQAAARALSNMIEQEMCSEVAHAIAQSDHNTQRYILEAIRKASPLAGRELDGLLGKLPEPSRKEQEEFIAEQTPSRDTHLPPKEDRDNWSLWRWLRRFLESRS